MFTELPEFIPSKELLDSHKHEDHPIFIPPKNWKMIDAIAFITNNDPEHTAGIIQDFMDNAKHSLVMVKNIKVRLKKGSICLKCIQQDTSAMKFRCNDKLYLPPSEERN